MLVPDLSTNEHESLRKSLEELLKLMLVIWCKENQAIKLVSGKPNADTDKTIIIQKQGGQFGFRMHGSKPILVSAIESDTPAETSGLEVGDAILTINGINVLDKTHSEVIEVVKTAGDTLVLEVLKTSTILNPVKVEVMEEEEESLYCGYLWKLAGYASGIPSGKWLRRWFTLKADNCLYYYKTDSDNLPVGAVLLLNYEVEKITDTNSATFRFDLKKIGAPILHLAADTEQGAGKWMDAITKIVTQLDDARIEQIKWNRLLAPNAITDPQCFGYLTKLGLKESNKRYCVLKNDCLYFYYDINSQSALGVAFLAGYKVQKSTDSPKYAFVMIPDDLAKKTFQFCTESEEDQKRWLTALEYSIKQS